RRPKHRSPRAGRDRRPSLRRELPCDKNGQKPHPGATCQGEISPPRGFLGGGRLRYRAVMRRVSPLVLLAFTTAVAADSVQTEAVGIRFAAPREWKRVPAPSELRAAQYRIARAPGGGDDGVLVLFFFGKGKVGS